jgi:hypothetical protein
MIPPSPNDPFMPVDWRWRRASFLASQLTACPHQLDDDWVWAAVDFLKLTRCQTESDQHRLTRTMPALWQARAVFNAQPPFLKWAVEAYILAQESFPEIARKCGLMVDAVTAYERLFFAVSEHLTAPVWILTQAIGEKAFSGLTERDLDVVWKLFGYHHGPLVLDCLIHNVLHRDRPEESGQVDDCIIRETRALLNRQSALAALLLPVTRETALKIVKLHAQQSAREGASANPQNGSIGNHAVLSQVALSMEALRSASTSSPVVSGHPENAPVPRRRIAV